MGPSSRQYFGTLIRGRWHVSCLLYTHQLIKYRTDDMKCGGTLQLSVVFSPLENLHLEDNQKYICFIIEDNFEYVRSPPLHAVMTTVNKFLWWPGCSNGLGSWFKKLTCTDQCSLSDTCLRSEVLSEPASSIDRHDMTEILLKVALNPNQSINTSSLLKAGCDILCFINIIKVQPNLFYLQIYERIY